jgi:glycosyltransferase involved in cell wall biosynthesis
MKNPHGVESKPDSPIFVPVRVFLLAPEPPARDVLRALVALGIAPIVARPTGDTSADGQVQYLRVATRGDARDPMDLRWSRKALRSAVRDTGPALLHIVGDPWTPTAEAGAAAARDLKVPYVLVGTSSLGGPSGFTSRWQARRVRDGAGGLAGVARPALDHLIGGSTPLPTAVIPPSGLVIPAAVPTRRDPPPVVFGVRGRLVRERGLDLLLDALAETYGDWRLRILGTGPAQEALEAQAQRLGLSSRLEWLGALPREEHAAFFASVDVVVAPSRSTPQWVEPTGMVVLEGMAQGCGTIVTRCGALPDVVGESGMIVAEDDRAALTRALQGLVTDPARCRPLGAAARHRVLERYSDGPIAEAMVAMWRRVAK